jgi:hypothetical protein
MKNICYLLLAFTLIVLPACKKDPLTGDLKITLSYNANINFSSYSYSLYTEGSWAASTPVSPLLSGNVTSAGTIVIRDLNPGNYVILINNIGIHKQVQVTAGREREFKI